MDCYNSLELTCKARQRQNEIPDIEEDLRTENERRGEGL